MGLNFTNLDSETRGFMAEEIKLAIADGTIYLSPWLTPQGTKDWAELLLQAATDGNDESFAAALRIGGRIRATAERKKPTGGMTTYKVPVTASHTMAEGEFNRFYVRGLCRRATASGVPHLVVYRAKQVAEPRPESEAMIGKHVDPHAILQDLRTSAGVEPALGLPPGPNSGLTVRLP